ncbi:hypothetical protein, partial [Cylindrospermopsis raciborskii]
IKAETSPIVAIKKILELIGVKLRRQGREAKGQRLWVYKVEKNPLFETIKSTNGRSCRGLELYERGLGRGNN